MGQMNINFQSGVIKTKGGAERFLVPQYEEALRLETTLSKVGQRFLNFYIAATKQ